MISFKKLRFVQNNDTKIVTHTIHPFALHRNVRSYCRFIHVLTIRNGSRMTVRSFEHSCFYYYRTSKFPLTIANKLLHIANSTNNQSEYLFFSTVLIHRSVSNCFTMQDLILNIDNKEILNEVSETTNRIQINNTNTIIVIVDIFSFIDFASFHRLFDWINEAKKCTNHKNKP